MPGPGDYCIENDFIEEEDDEDEDEEVEDFVGEGRFRDGSDSGDVNTFSERVFVQQQLLQHKWMKNTEEEREIYIYFFLGISFSKERKNNIFCIL